MICLPSGSSPGHSASAIALLTMTAELAALASAGSKSRPRRTESPTTPKYPGSTAFASRTSYEPTTAGAKREPGGDFPAPRRTARHLHAGEVHARDRDERETKRDDAANNNKQHAAPQVGRKSVALEER